MKTTTQKGSAVVSGLSYQAALTAARKEPGRVFVIDSGEGWTSEISFCTWRKRVVAVAISPTGARVV